jgi:hypothetical protein
MMKPQTRPASAFEAGRIQALRTGAWQGLLMYLVLRQRGLRFTWLIVVSLGMTLAAHALLVAQLCQAGVITPWP